MVLLERIVSEQLWLADREKSSRVTKQKKPDKNSTVIDWVNTLNFTANNGFKK
jgi:hypothetical protein